ncbi:MAG: Rrf2 family transcriptional regulator [Alphaproteobacteria bacterium]|nr:Rrf2 family transcriptional regulator [Alphaproteobacteria bacterium]
MKLKISKRMAFAIISVVDIAYINSDRPIHTSDIASRHNIPKRYLEKVLQSLVKDNILKGTRGSGGGYTLACEKRKISLADIAKVVIKIEESEQKKAQHDSDLKSWIDNVLNPIWQDMNNSNMDYLEKISLQDLFKIVAEKDIVLENENE